MFSYNCKRNMRALGHSYCAKPSTLRINTTNQWSLPRLGGAVQSFNGRRGSSQAPPFIDSDTVFIVRAESRSMKAGLKQEDEEEEEGVDEEQPNHRWKSA